MLSAGTMIGPYRIEREIGRGGMGVIFLAQDTRLGRAAAIKALPEDVAGDPDRLARFEREAKALASLSHPNVAGIYGLEESEGRRYLALEYVEGESLAERLARGPLSVPDSIDICLQIAAGIEAAHEAGIIHRDLKPGNVVITAADQAKVLDFGLAKGRVVEGTGAASPTNAAANSPTIAESPTLLHSPTMQTPATMPGVILGTAAYLSPEQARGKPVDRRTDIWSFGCLLYECLTARLAFEGETVSDTIAKILEREMNYDALPASTPAALRALLSRCLEKDARRRLRDIGDARLTLEELKAGSSSAALAAIGVAQAAAVEGAADPAAGTAAAASAKRRGLLITAAAFAAGALLTAAAWSGFGLGGRASRGAVVESARLSVAIPDNLRLQDAQITRDGASMVVRAVLRDPPKGEEPVSMLYVRSIAGATFEPLRGTERVQGFRLYPDGRWAGYTVPVSERSTKVKRMKVPLDGSAPATEMGLWEDSWIAPPAVLESGELLVVVAPQNKYVRIPAVGGAASAPLPLEGLDSLSSASFSAVLPGDRGALLSIFSYGGTTYEQDTGVLDLKSGKVKVLVRNAGSPRYAESGHLLFSRRDALFAVPFDLGRLEVKGQPTAILDGLRVTTAWGNAGFESTKNGMLIFAPGGFVGKDRRLVVVDSEGRSTDWSGERLPFEVGAWISPDGARVASVVANAAAIYEIWISDRDGKSSRRVIAREGVDCSMPCWSPDGTRIAYYHGAQSEKDGVYVVRADGSGEARRIAVAVKGVSLFPTAWTRDGSCLLVTRIEGGTFSLLSFPASETQMNPSEPEWIFPKGAGIRGLATLSPDNAHVAYFSDEGGPPQVFVRPWNGRSVAGDGVPMGRAGGSTIVWSPDSRRVRFIDEGGNMVESELTTSPRLSASSPKILWNARDLGLLSTFATPLPDGRVVAIRRGDSEDDITRMDVVLGFPRLLEERLRRVSAK